MRIGSARLAASLLILLLSPICLLNGQTSPMLPLSIPFEFQYNTIYLRVGINGHSPVLFGLDTGASACIIDTALAKRLGLVTHGEDRGTGAGRGTFAVTYTDNVRYNLPGLDFTVPQSKVIDLSGEPAIGGRDLVGLLGYDFFARYVVAVDYDADVITLFDPAHYSYFGKGTAIPFKLITNRPYITVQATISNGPGIDREALIDSGSADAFDDDLLASSPKRLESIVGVGLGEEYKSTVARAKKIAIGPYSFDDPWGAPGISLIGTEILRRFYVVFDYDHNQVFFEPNRHYDDEFDFDASGLILRWTPDAFLIHDVAKGSAAAEVGLRTGDAIIAVNGQSAANFRLNQVVELLRHAGTVVQLRVRRGPSQLQVSLTLRNRL